MRLSRHVEIICVAIQIGDKLNRVVHLLEVNIPLTEGAWKGRAGLSEHHELSSSSQQLVFCPCQL